jgi:hypothetical protein
VSKANCTGLGGGHRDAVLLGLGAGAGLEGALGGQELGRELMPSVSDSSQSTTVAVMPRPAWRSHHASVR